MFGSEFIKRPIFTTVLNLMILTIGIVSFNKLELRGTPNIAPPVIMVNASYKGADASYMEGQIVRRLEEVLKTTKNLDIMTSSSSTGAANIYLSFKLDADIDVGLSDVRSKISSISNMFPRDMNIPSAQKLDIDGWPSIWISINSDRHTDLELTQITNNQIKDELEKLPTVGQSILYGGKFYTMKIEPHESKLLQHKISLIQLEQSIVNQNKSYPAGVIKSDTRRYSLKLDASLKSPSEFEDIIVKKYQDGTLIKLKDIARVSLEPQEEDVILRYNGKRALAIGLIKQSTANIIELSKEVKRELEKIKNNIPEGISIEIAVDNAVALKESIDDVFFSIFEAIILVGLVTYIFLGSVKITIIPLVTIPISLIGSFAAIHWCGFSINSFSLLAMLLAIGLVVDDAIVMLENIFRHKYELGKGTMQASQDGAYEISFAVVAMTLTLASVFLPIGFLEGFLGKIFIEFAWTLAFCVLFSGFVSLTLTPMMCSKMMGDRIISKPKILQNFDIYFELTQNLYINLLQKALGNKKTFFAFSSLSIVVLIAGFYFTGKTFVPDEDQAFLRVSFSGPEGSSLKETEKSVIAAEEVMKKDKDIQGYFVAIGSGGSENAMAFVPLTAWSDRKRSQLDIQQDLNKKFAEIPGMSIFAMNPSSFGFGGSGFDIEFSILSSLDYDKLDILSKKFISSMEKASIFTNIDRDFKASTPTIDILIHKDKAYKYGASLENIGTTIQYLITGKIVGDFMMGNDIYNVLLQSNALLRKDPANLRGILIQTNDNSFIPLSNFAALKEKISVKSYNHYNSSRAIAITCNLKKGVDLAKAQNILEEISKEVLDKNNSRIEYEGNIKQMSESFSGIIFTFCLAMVFIFLVLAAQFESFLDALLILITVPFSITGGVVALYFFGSTINMYSNIGFATLIGLVTKNAIMIIEFANQLRMHTTEGHERENSSVDAVIKSAYLRFRPIIMTSIATIVGAVPLVLATGAGAAARNSIGLVIAGGMSVGTIFTIFVIPVLYASCKK